MTFRRSTAPDYSRRARRCVRDGWRDAPVTLPLLKRRSGGHTMKSLANGRIARWVSITTVLIVTFASGAAGAGQPSDDFVVYEDWTTADHIRSDRWSQAGDVSQDTRAE